MNNELNILFLKDTIHLLKNEDLNFLILVDNNKLTINNIPLIYTDYLHILYDNLAYDYDSLSEENKEKYKLKFKKLKKIDNYYVYDTKKYIKK